MLMFGNVAMPQQILLKDTHHCLRAAAVLKSLMSKHQTVASSPSISLLPKEAFCCNAATD
jgi:hypothetical protein